MLGLIGGTRARRGIGGTEMGGRRCGNGYGFMMINDWCGGLSVQSLFNLLNGNYNYAPGSNRVALLFFLSHRGGIL